MKRKFAFTLLMGLIVGAAALSSCSKENEQPKPKPTPTPTPKEEPKPTNGLPEITKVTFRIGESHLHSKKGIHFLGNNAVLNHSLLKQEQLITFVKKGNDWALEAGSPDRLLAIEMIQYIQKDITSAAPDYALWVSYFDAQGKQVNAAYADAKVRSQYQLFVYPTEVKAFEGQEAITFDPKDPTNVLRYEYCDSDPWDKSVQKSLKQDPEDKQAKWLPSTEPIGMKGYMQFPKVSHFKLHLALWHAPEGKLQDKKPAPFFQPNEQFTKKGSKIFEVTFPVYVYGTREFTDELRAPFDGKPIPYANLRDDYKAMADHLMTGLGTKDWLKIAEDFIRIYKGTGGEGGGEEF